MEELEAGEGSDSGGDESLGENGESPCEGEDKQDGKEAPEKAKVPQAQRFKGTTTLGAFFFPYLLFMNKQEGFFFSRLR